MLPKKISLINASTVVSDAEAAALAQALQWQVTHDFAPVWGIDALLDFVPRGQQPPDGHWWLTLLDDADMAGALGYHDITPADQPAGKVFCKTTRDDGGSVSVTASHELLEMLGDPFVNQAAVVADGRGTTQVIAWENCDACEGGQFAYKTQGGALVSDFVYPAFFDANARNQRFDHTGHVQQPFQILPGGYLSVFSTRAGWQQVTADQAAHHAAEQRYFGNRFWRRRLRHQGQVFRSTAHTSAPVHARQADHAVNVARPVELPAGLPEIVPDAPVA